MQKEAFFFQVPCVTLRDETEWIETVELGWNILVGAEPDRILEAVRLAHLGAKRETPYGDGQAAKRIVELVSVAELAES